MKDFNWQNYPRRILTDQDPYLPFPGIYPTRWAIELKWGESRRAGFTHKWRYLGKPNTPAAIFLRAILHHSPYSTVTATEFIQNGAIARSIHRGPRLQLNVIDWNANKFRLVDPWYGYPNGRLITHWAEYRMRALPLTHKGHKFVIYATQAATATKRNLEVYRVWLENANIVFSRR